MPIELGNKERRQQTKSKVDAAVARFEDKVHNVLAGAYEEHMNNLRHRKNVGVESLENILRIKLVRCYNELMKDLDLPLNMEPDPKTVGRKPIDMTIVRPEGRDMVKRAEYLNRQIEGFKGQIEESARDIHRLCMSKADSKVVEGRLNSLTKKFVKAAKVIVASAAAFVAVFGAFGAAIGGGPGAFMFSAFLLAAPVTAVKSAPLALTAVATAVSCCCGAMTMGDLSSKEGDKINKLAKDLATKTHQISSVATSKARH